jgi:cell division protein FtsL
MMMRLFDRRYRGFRIVNFAAFAVLLMLAVGVYLAKTSAGREAAAIVKVDREIAGEKAQIRLLRADVAALEQPDRISKLSTNYLGLAPVDAKHEATLDKLPELAGARSAPPAPVVTP